MTPPNDTSPHVSSGTDSEPIVLLTPMTVESLIDALSRMPGDLEVLVHARDRDDFEVFGALKEAVVDGTCAGPDVCRLFADQEEGA